MVKITKKNYIFHPIKKPLTSWRSLKGSLSSAIFQKLSDGFKVYKIYMKFGYLKSFYSLFILSLNFIKKKISMIYLFSIFFYLFYKYFFKKVI